MGMRETLGRFGGIIAGGFGDRAVIGLTIGMLDDKTPEEFYFFIKEGKDLVACVSSEDWDFYGELAQQTNIGDITADRILEEFRKHRPEFAHIIVNQPGAMAWLDKQVALIKERLGITPS